MRLAYCSDGYSIHDYRLLRKLAQSELDVWFVRFSVNPNPIEVRPIPEGIKVPDWLGLHGYYRSSWEKVQLWFDFRRLMRQIRPDVIHAGPIHSCGLYVSVAGLHPFLLQTWGSDVLVLPKRGLFWRLIALYVIRQADMITSDCDTVAKGVTLLSGYPRERIAVIPRGIELQEFYPRPSRLGLRQQLGWQNKTVIISTRPFEPLYGLEDMVHAVGRLVQRYPDVRVLMTNDGSLRGKIGALVEDMGLAEIFHLTGRLEHGYIVDYLNEADINCTTSYSDGSSASLMEALACGVPSVTSDLPSNREWVEPGVEGWLIEPGNVESIARGLRKAIQQDSAQRLTMKQNCIRKAQERADWDKNFQRVLSLYEQVYAESQMHA